MDYGIKVLAAYLLGSIVGSLLLGRLKGVDIRQMGSGNAGATNAIRTQGKGFGIAVFAIDLAKGWLASGLLPQLELPGVPPSTPELAAWLAPSCALAAILGHVFPLWHGFRGGKGVATLIGAFAGYDAWLLLPMFATWLGVILVSGFVGLASICAAISLPIYLLLRDAADWNPELYLGIACALLVIFTHRGNVGRMRAGTEPRARRLWLFGRGGA